MHIPVDLKVEVPENNVIEPFDLAVVIGNLFDNAIEALSNLPESERHLELSIQYLKGCLLIHSSNPYQGEILLHNGKIVTKKSDSALHGIGLNSIETTISKYNGELKISTEHSIFTIQILIYTN
ncbi:MAG: sensor histidine kinase [Clostridia bacterium]|nr:sensor histidine kinase [Clostridia bacterium]